METLLFEFQEKIARESLDIQRYLVQIGFGTIIPVWLFGLMY
ncbi:hypothetical protein ABDK00_009660 [Niabella insulamsoli]